MLVLHSYPATNVPEDVEMNFSFASVGSTDDFGSPSFRHPLRLRGVLRDGTEVALGRRLNRVRLDLPLDARDQGLQGWLDLLGASLPQIRRGVV